MATIQDYSELRPLGENFNEERFIGLEIETTRNRTSIPDKYEYEEYHESYSDEIPEYDDMMEVFDPSGLVVANVGYDGGDIELATQPLSLEVVKYNDDVREFMRRLNLYGIADDASGTHVHVSKLEKDNEKLWRNLYWFSVACDKQLYKVFRRCSHWAKSPRRVLKERYGEKVNINQLIELPTNGIKATLIVNRENTYECRGGSATTSRKELIAWSILFKNIVDFCNQDSIVGHRFEEILPEGEWGDLLKINLTKEQQRQIIPIEIYL